MACVADRKKEARFSLGLCTGVLAGGVAVFFLHRGFVHEPIEAQASDSARVHAAHNEEQDAVGHHDMTPAQQEWLDKIALISALQHNRAQVVQWMDGLAHSLPEGLTLTHIARLDQQLLIEGRAESNAKISTFMRDIEGAGLITSPQLTQIQADTHDKPGLHFHLQGHFSVI